MMDGKLFEIIIKQSFSKPLKEVCKMKNVSHSIGMHCRVLKSFLEKESLFTRPLILLNN